ncbi:hypothetical protein GCM10027615_04320 [Plantactinospora veratri]
MPPLVRYLVEQRERGGTLIVVDPRATATARQAHLHLQPTPGTDLAVANALLHIALAEGLVDKDYVAARTSGFDQVRRVTAGYWPARAERLSGVPVADLEAAARALGTADRAIILTARGAEQHAKGVDTVTAFINLALALGLPGRPGSGYGCLTGQGNGQGGREHGQKADQLPGYRRIDDPAARAHVAGVWGCSPTRCPARACRRTNCSAPSAPTAARGGCWCSAPTRSSRHPGRAGSPAGCATSTCWWWPTSSAPRPPRSPTWCCRPPSGPRRTAR